MRVLAQGILAAAIALSGTGAAGAADFEWRYVGAVPRGHDYAKIMIEGFERVAERTNGALVIEYVSYGETPYKLADALTLVRDELVEMNEWVPNQSSSTYPLLAGPELPFLMPDLRSAAEFLAWTRAAWATPTAKAYRDKIVADHNAISLMTPFYDPINIWFADVVTDAAGFEGKKVRAANPELAEWLVAAGATPVNIAPADQYTGLQRGVVDGIVTGTLAVIGFKLDEVLHSGFATNAIMWSTDMLVSKPAFDSLPEDAQKILMEEMERAEEELHKLMPKNYEAGMQKLLDEGLTVTVPSPELYQQFRQYAVENVYPKWVERAGPEGEKMLSEIEAVTQ